MQQNVYICRSINIFPMKKAFILIAASMALLVSCKSNEQKSIELAAKAVMDSTLFANVQNAINVVDKCIAEEAYLAGLPKGPHAKEIKADLAANKAKVEELNSLIARLKDGFAKYSFRAENNDLYEFSGPDSLGRGSANISPAHIEDKCGYANRIGIVDRDIECSYFINDDGQIVLSQSETRTYSFRRTHLGGPTEWDKDIMRRIRSKYPTPEPIEAILSYDTEDDAPVISGADQSGKNWYFQPELK